MSIEIEFDDAKEAANIAKHGVSLRVGAVVIANLVGDEIDESESGEERVRAFGLFGMRLFVAVYTMRGETFRIISVRKATKTEEKKWLR